MSDPFKKLVNLLKELFQLDHPDLDFGIYRIMRARSAEIAKFLEQDLLPQVREAFALYQSADKATLEQQLQDAIQKAHDLGVDPETTQAVKDLRARIAKESVDLEALEGDVYDHLYRFFRRYYNEGDFISRRVYKEGVYAIPYEGEEVKLYWANHDQYYIKTSEYLRDYTFRLRPDNETNPMRVHFRLVDAAEGAHNNVKESNKRVFVLAPGDFIGLEDGPAGKELVIRFEYRPATLNDWPDDQREGKSKPPEQKDLLSFAEQRIRAVDSGELVPWLDELSKPHIKADGEQAEYSRLRAHLNRYTARNTFDYFIHKDLGGFLRRELDFYIKNEVLRLDDIEGESSPRVEQFLSKVRVIRKIAHKFIDFLAQLEDFQKKLWLKKKFVTETSWCVRVGIIPEEFYPEICANDAQREEWVRLHAIDELGDAQGNLTAPGAPGYSEPLTPEFLTAHPTLMVDTRHFGEDFASRLLEAIGHLDERIDGVLVHGENFQALNLMQDRFKEQIYCIYLDPPYNTGNDNDFAYKDNYRHSSWLSMMFDRVSLCRHLSAPSAGLFISTDDGEYANLRLLLGKAWGEENFIADIIWNSRKSVSSDALISVSTNHTTFFAANRPVLESEKSRFRLPQDESGFANPDNDPRGPWKLDPMDAPNIRENLTYPITNPKTGERFYPPEGRCWRFEQWQTEQLLQEGRILFGRRGTGRPMYKRFLSEAKLKGKTPTTLWDDVRTTTDATKLLLEVFGNNITRALINKLKPKPPELVHRCVALLTNGSGAILDYFAGSGTTGHAVINLNREDGGRRKFILVEMADYFDTVLLPRLKKITFAPEWKDGKPRRLASEEEAERSPRIFKVIRLESYEDTLNNLELKRTQAQEDLFSRPEAQGPDGLREQYILRYMLDVETRESPSLLNVSAFTDPTQYRLKVKVPGSDESREVCVDLIETFNWLIGLVVHHMSAPRRFTAQFKRAEDPDLPKDAPRRLLLDGRLREAPDGRWWFRTIEGETRDGRKTLVIWRNRPGGEDPKGIEQDNLVLEAWFQRQGYSSKDSEFDLIYVNGTNNLENLKAPDDTWKVRLIEEDFHRLMFDTEDVL